MACTLLAGVCLPAASFTTGEMPRGSSVDVTGDRNGALTLDSAQAVHINSTSPLVNVTDHLGRDVTVTVTLRTDSTDVGDLVVDSVVVGDRTSFTLGDGSGQRVELQVPDNESLTGSVVYFRVTASTAGLTARATNRSVPVKA